MGGAEMGARAWIRGIGGADDLGRGRASGVRPRGRRDGRGACAGARPKRRLDGASVAASRHASARALKPRPRRDLQSPHHALF